jgi:carboxyl-terminal processing protease
MRKGWVITIALVSALTLSLTVRSAVAADSTDALFQRIRVVYNVVQAFHKDGADAQKFTDGAIKGGLEALGDPYTNYFSASDYQTFLDSLNGSFSGIGAFLETNDNYIVIASPIKGTPADRAGLTSGDRILEVDGTPLIGASTEKAVNLIHGAAGTPVQLKIERPSENRTFTITLIREKVSMPEVDSKLLEPEIGYVQISSFGDDAANDFYKAVDGLKAKGAKALVLDLRQNGGGYLDAAVDIASGFVPAGQPILWEVGKTGKSPVNSSGKLINLPVVVLVDNGSASASEILAGALQDYGTPLVGVKSFGKGTVQQILSLTSGGGMKVTIAEYLTAKERHVHKIGLTPDYVVTNPKPAAERTGPLVLTRPLLPSTAGLDVLYLQYRLQDLGYNVETTGFFGVSTDAAVAAYASSHGLEPLVNGAFAANLNQAVANYWRTTQQKDAQLDKAVEVIKAKLHP